MNLSFSGLVFRAFAGEVDYPKFVALNNICWPYDGDEMIDTLEQARNHFKHLQGCDPFTDMVLAEHNGELVAYASVRRWENDEGERLYGMGGQVHPAWRHKGLGAQLLAWTESRAREIDAAQPANTRTFLSGGAEEKLADKRALFGHAGYREVRYGHEMHRDLTMPIPNLDLPAGIDIRPVRWPDQAREIHKAMDEAFRDHYGHRPTTEVDFQSWLNWNMHQPERWQLAWSGDEIAGMAANTVFAEENKKFGRKIGWTDPIFVRRPWRKQGLAKALIARSLAALKEAGMDTAALGVDAQNPNGALALYESMGYRQVKRWISYRKEINHGQ
jgi:mycothiol synthase